MDSTIFWGGFLLVIAIACEVAAYLMWLRPRGTVKRCSKTVMGKINGQANDHESLTMIPLVEYFHEGKRYKVAGPRFKSITQKRTKEAFANPKAKFETNLTTREELPDKLVITLHKKAVVSDYLNPLGELYRQGSTAEVHYNPKNPKEAYVQRYVQSFSLIGVGCLIVGLISLALALFFIIAGLMM